MDWNGAVTITNDLSGVSATRRLLLFLGHLDSQVYLSDTAFVEVGAGSLGCEERVSMVSASATGSLGRIGRYCEFGACDVMAMGDHANDRAVNVSLNSTLFASLVADQEKRWLRQKGPINIGDNVVISNGARVLPGVQVGTGSVVGASALVSRPVDPFTIVGGVPAKVLAERPRCTSWWDFHPAEIAELVMSGRIDEEAAAGAELRLAPDRPLLVYRRLGSELRLVGVAERHAHGCIEPLSTPLSEYAAQALGVGPYTWLADPLSA